MLLNLPEKEVEINAKLWAKRVLHPMLQVTPVFGIFNDIEARRRDARLAAAAAPPALVIFIYVASQKNELALLQRRLIADARCAASLAF
jgi:hypothetical protein